MDKVKNFNKLYDIKGFEDYQITKSGKIFSKLTKKYLKYDITKQGYCRVKLMDRRLGKIVNQSVHRLVAIQFIPNPGNLPQINHINGDKKNNSIYNLEWCTSEYNIRHARETRLFKIEEDSPTAKLTKEQVIFIHWMSKVRGFNCKTLSRMFGVSDATIGNIIKGKRWSEVYKELYGEYSQYKIKKRTFISDDIIEKIIRDYYLNNLSGLQIEKLYNVNNSYISSLVRGHGIAKNFKDVFKEIYETLDNQQPSLSNFRKVQRLKGACLLLGIIDNDIV